MFFDLLHFGSGPQAVNYFVFCLAGVLGTIQIVAARYSRFDLLWFEGRLGYAFGALTVVSSFVWFFLTDQEIFIPGLAGGELFTLFVSAFIVAIPTTRVVTFAAARVRAFAVAPKTPAREKEPLI